MSCPWGIIGWVTIFATALSGCVTSGSTATEMKEELQGSFLYKSATAFQSEDSRDPFNVDARIAETNKRLIRDEFDGIVRVLTQKIELHRTPLSHAFPTMRGQSRSARVLMSDRGLDAPFINASHEIFVDIRVARLMYRDAVLSSMRSSGLGTVAFMANDRDQKCATTQPDAMLLDCFLAMKSRVDRLKKQGSLGLGFSLLGSVFSDDRKFDFDNSPWFVAADLQLSSIDLQTRYYGVLLFVVAHEIAHVMLGHVDPANRDRLLNPEARRQAEIDADAFAVTLLALSTAQGMYFSQFENLAIGFESFFSKTYPNARWYEAGGDSHPSRESRLQSARKLHEQLRNTQQEQFWAVIERNMTERLPAKTN